jgi:DNA polymerase
MTKHEQLEKLKKRMAAAALPLDTNIVFGEGDADARIFFIGEAPGAKEDETGRPFVGRSGQLLTRQIERIGWKREDVYITSIVKRRPPDNRDPSPVEIAAYEPYLIEQLNIINPLLVVTLGRFSTMHFLPAAKITQVQGTVVEVGGRFIMPMLHPAAALRAPKMMKLFEDTFTRLPEILAICESEVRKSAN